MFLTKQYTQLLPLALIVVGLLSYNFMSAQWQAPTATAPNNNTEAPINISANYQAKLGDLGAVRMRAGQYCNADGTVCVTDVQRRVSSTCPAGQAIRTINADGTVTCQTVPTGTSITSCALQTVRATGCGGIPPCPAGYLPTSGHWQGGSCSGSNDFVYVQCGRVVCS